MFPVYGRKCLSRKTVHKWAEKLCKYFTDDEEVETEMRKWPRQQSKDFYAACFDALVKRWDNVSMVVEDTSRNKCFFFPGSKIMFYVLYPFVTYLPTLPRICFFPDRKIGHLYICWYFFFNSSGTWPPVITLRLWQTANRIMNFALWTPSRNVTIHISWDCLFCSFIRVNWSGKKTRSSGKN
jgi:hypothetical protein